jgi:hypothetical protein
MPVIGIKPALIFPGGSVQNSMKRTTSMGLSAILIATALSLTMLVAVSDLP